MALLLVALVAGSPVAALIYFAVTRPDPGHEFAISLIGDCLVDAGQPLPFVSPRHDADGTYRRSA